jgi:hypothetical protein
MEDIDHLRYVPARIQSTRPKGTVISWVIIHDMESPETGTGAEDCARWFQNPAAKGSAHICADNNSCVRSVYDDAMAAGAPGSNTQGLHIEICGYARQTKADWFDQFSLDAMDNAANCVAQWLHKHNLPNQYVDVAGLIAGKKGWSTHANVTKAFKRSTHTDPGEGFPRDYFQERINYHYYPQDGDAELNADERKKLDEIHNSTMEMYQAVVGTYVPEWGNDNPRAKSIMTRMQYLFGESIGDPKSLADFRALMDNAVKDSDNIDTLLEKIGELEAEIQALKPNA